MKHFRLGSLEFKLLQYRIFLRTENSAVIDFSQVFKLHHEGEDEGALFQI